MDALQQQGVDIQVQLSLHRKAVKKWLIDNYLLLRGKSSLDDTDYIARYCDDAENITLTTWKEHWSLFSVFSGTKVMMGDELTLIAPRTHFVVQDQRHDQRRNDHIATFWHTLS